jgi:hypothetical protein
MSGQAVVSTTSLDELVEHLDDLVNLANWEGFTEFACLIAEARLTVLRYPLRFQPGSDPLPQDVAPSPR